MKDSTPHPDAPFVRDLVEAARSRRSWRERLQWVRDRLTDPAFTATPGRLAAVAVYLRFLATGEVRCEEDGRHFRPNHHAEAALQIEQALERLGGPETGWVLRRIYPYLPSWGEEFRRSEPLTRIRDIAHRNDIPPDLKREIKHRLQNKLHRCAGPEDLRTSEEILGRITSPGAGYAQAFVAEFKVFHEELREFFNASALEARLRAITDGAEAPLAQAVNDFLSAKAEGSSVEQLLARLERLTGLRQLLAARLPREEPHRRSQLRLADIGLEDRAFSLLSELTNHLEGPSYPHAWPALLRGLAAALENLRLSTIEPDECAALRSEASAWAAGFSPEDHLHLLRTRATLGRARRLAEDYTDRVYRLFAPRVEEIGRALGVADHAVAVFVEGDVRGHVVFQLSRLVDLGLSWTQSALSLPPWEAIVAGESTGTLVRVSDLAEVEGKPGPLLLLLGRADGDAEIPAGVQGIALGHPMPHLSHFGVRARQARIPFACCAGPEHLNDFAPLAGKWVRFRVGPDGLSVQEETRGAGTDHARPAQPPLVLAPAPLSQGPSVLPLEEARAETCGAKAAGARQLRELAARSGGLFHAPRGLAVPFEVMERSLDANPALRQEYRALQDRLAVAPPRELDALLGQLRHLVRRLPVPGEISQAVASTFGPGVRLAVRSSSNGEDLEHLAGAGLYESVVNVPPEGVAGAVAQVWSSLWTRRATLSRTQAGIPHAHLRMAVLIQELVAPDWSFILHTADPLTGNRDQAVAEVAVGLGEVLASASVPGTPYRLACPRKGGPARLLSCASFSTALRPPLSVGAAGAVAERLDYSKVPLSAHPGAAPKLGERLARVAEFLEGELGRPQDVEGVCVGEEVHLVQTRPQQGL